MGSAGAPRRLSPPVVAALAGAAVTVLVPVVPSLRFAYANPTLHVAIETAIGVVGLLVAYVVAGRFRLSRSISDLLLAAAFALLGGTGLLVGVVPAVMLEDRPTGYATWLAVGLRVVAAATVWLAAMSASARRVAHPVRWAAGAVIALIMVAAIALAADLWLSTGLDPELSPAASGRPLLVGHPLILACQLLAAGLWAWAATRFWRRREEAPLLGWLATGATLAAFARASYFLFPSLYSNWVYVGDVLRVGAYAAFLVGVARELDSWVRLRASSARQEERRRVARDLHDGLTQELSFIRSHLTAARVPDEMLPFLAEAADRAVRESRRLVATLSEDDAPDLARVLRAAAEDITTRSGVSLRAEVADLRLDAACVDGLIGLVREATANAVTHGLAGRVTVRLLVERGEAVLTVSDDGVGFDPVVPAAGFGRRSMEERAASLGGRLSIRSRLGEGTTVAVRFPADSVR